MPPVPGRLTGEKSQLHSRVVSSRLRYQVQEPEGFSRWGPLAIRSRGGRPSFKRPPAFPCRCSFRDRPLAARANRGRTSGSVWARSASAAGRRCCWSNCPRTAGSWPCATAICRGPKPSRPSRKADWPVYQDYRKLLERKDIDAVIVGTARVPAGAAVHPRLPGRQGRLRREAADALHPRRPRAGRTPCGSTSRVFQVGTQQRSMAMNRIACELVRTGGLGKVLEVRAINYTGLRGARPAQPCPERAGARRARLGRVARTRRPGGRSTSSGWAGWLARLRRRRNDQLGRARRRPDPVGAGHGRHRPGGNVAADAGPQRPGRDALCQRRAGPLRARARHGPMGGAIFVCEKGKLEINRNKFTSNPPEIAAELLKKVDEAEEERKWSDQTGPLAGPLAPAELARLHPHAGRSRSPTSRSAIARSASATWRTSRGWVGRRSEVGPGQGAVRRRRRGQHATSIVRAARVMSCP